MQPFEYLNVEQAAALMQQGAVVVDIRDENSFALGHMPGSIQLDTHSVSQFIQQADLDAPTIVVCYHGHSSQSAAAWLNSQGFDRVYSMDGGFTQWAVQFPDRVEIG
ncbi:MAG: thiosulfate sulfurtransferase GlpE [Thiopseudomonas sp.]|nr:thiosulfate sulfurtransferase GlpE [Thiopseudomonas sp.]